MQQAPAHVIPDRGRTLAIAFGVVVAMWVIAYFALMQPGLVMGELLFVFTLGCIVAGGFFAGRHRRMNESAAVAGAKVGLLVGVLNLLVVGAMLVDPQTRSLRPDALYWVAGNFAISIALTVVGAVIGGLKPLDSVRPINWFGRFTIIAAATVFLLLITGGLVTGLKAGLAVPDWPTSFGHNMLLYPLSEMTGGVYYEHAHRLYGMLVGVTAIALVIAAFLFDTRGWLRGLAIAYLIMVSTQGYMGGRRVSEISTFLAIVHGMFGQIVFATIVCIAAFTSTAWRKLHSIELPEFRSLSFIRKHAWMLVVGMVIQLGLGATYRHMHRAPFVRDAEGNPIAAATAPNPGLNHLLFTHIGLAVLITLLIVVVAGKSWAAKDQPVLPAIGRTLLILVGVQLVLGIVAWMAVMASDHSIDPPLLEVAVTTAHQANGALMFGCSALLLLWSKRLSCR